MNADVLVVLPPLVVAALDAGEPVSIGGSFVGRIPVKRTSVTPSSGPGAIERWLDLFDKATWLMSEPEPHDSRPQFTASKAIDSLFAYEHQLTPLTRRQAREALWQRDRPDDPLPMTPHEAGNLPLCCHCPTCRCEWESCRCRTCRLARLLNRPVSS